MQELLRKEKKSKTDRLKDDHYELVQYLQTAPCPRRSLQNLLQQLSLSSVPSKPASHSSFFSTRKLPQKDSWGSEKHRPDFACNTLRMDLRLQGENF